MGYRVIVCGSRKYEFNWRHRVRGFLDRTLAEHPELIVVVGGCYTGADAMASAWADDHKVPCHTFLADWEDLGAKAGPIRNTQMVDAGASEVAAFWLPTNDKYTNRGTKDLCIKAWRAGIPVRACWGDSDLSPWHEKLFQKLDVR